MGTAHCFLDRCSPDRGIASSHSQSHSCCFLDVGIAPLPLQPAPPVDEFPQHHLIHYRLHYAPSTPLPIDVQCVIPHAIAQPPLDVLHRAPVDDGFAVGWVEYDSDLSGFSFTIATIAIATVISVAIALVAVVGRAAAVLTTLVTIA